MAFVHTRDSVVKLDNSGGTPVTITAYVTGVSFERTIAMHDVTTLGLNSPAFITGLKDGDQFTLELLWDTTIETQINSLFGLSSASTFEVAPEGTATGKRRIHVETFVAKIGIPIKVGDTVKVNVTFQKTGDVTSTVY